MQTIDELSEALERRPHSVRRSSSGSIKTHHSSGKLKEHKDGHSLLSMFKKSRIFLFIIPCCKLLIIQPLAGHIASRHDGHKEEDHQQHNGYPVLQIPEEGSPSAILNKLRDQHSALSDALLNASSLQFHTRSPVPETINEESPTHTVRSPGSWHSVRQQNRSSISTAISSTGSGTEWFDASEGEELGAEEFVLEDNEGDEDNSASSSRFTTGSETADENEVDKDLYYDSPDDESVTTVSVSRRTRLPARPLGDEGSLFAVLKKNVGQDLSNISFPVTFNEPLSLLQRHAEELEYHELLDKAAAADDWIDRMCHVAAFAVSGYACTKFRSGRKGL